MENLSFSSSELDVIIAALRRYKVFVNISNSCTRADYNFVCKLVRKIDDFNK